MRFIHGMISLSFSALASASELPVLHVDESRISVSGISSGGYMANQFHLAHGDVVSGVGIIAAGPYECAENSLMVALARCFDKPDSHPPVSELIVKAETRAAEGLLAPLSSLRSKPVWLFHGSRDVTVAKPVSDALYGFYQHFVAPEKLRYVTDVPSAHGFPTERSGNSCDSHETPYLNACGYDAAGELLNFIEPGLKKPVDPRGKLEHFEQTTYAPAGKSTLAQTGYVYVPVACAKGETCGIHVVFHGCQQNAETIGERFVREAGYNRWAEANRLIVLYPQTKSSLVPLNPKGCWDWWGYTGADYATVKANQIETIWNMLQAISGDTARPRE